MTQPEAWLRGIRDPANPVCDHLLRASEQIREDARRAAAMSTTRGATGFHLKHLSGSTDRLCTYAEGKQLSAAQLSALERERENGESADELVARIDAAFDRFDAIVRSTRAEDFASVRYVGRKQLPVALIGLLIHIVEHGQRHAGQAITTAKASGAAVQS
ncbi:MAG TPA: DinB family protein [Bryobacteraceae bacterium]|nr:DinB family protein [Bryobacteraceae bacterium]